MWFVLEFLAWLINNDYRRAGHKVQLYPTSALPYLSATGRPQQHNPGKTLKFALEGYDGEASEGLAGWIEEIRGERYIGSEEVALYWEDDPTPTA